MKVLMINGSPRPQGNTALALGELERTFTDLGIESETVQVGQQAVRGCIACGRCGELGRCVFDDAVNVLAPKFEAADGLVVASPVYYASASQYWNSIHGRAPGEAAADEEGRQTMRVLARNMAFLMRSIALGKERYGLPETEPHAWTHFIR